MLTDIHPFLTELNSLSIGQTQFAPNRRTSGNKKAKTRVQAPHNLFIISSVMFSSTLRKPFFRVPSTIDFRHISHSATVAAVAHDLQPAQTPSAPHGPVSSATQQRGEEFWRRVPVFEDVAASEFLSYQWSVSSPQTFSSKSQQSLADPSPSLSR